MVLLVWALVLWLPGPARWFGWTETGRYFDLRGSLAAGEWAARGGDPYTINPLDPYGRPHFYSSWWLVAGGRLTRADTEWLGTLGGLTILAAALAFARPRTWREAAVFAALLASPAWLLAVYRGNNDLVIFLGMLVVLTLWRGAGVVVRAVAAGLVGVLTVLKYFPAAAILGVVLSRRPRTRLLLVLVMVAVVAIGFPSLLPGLAAIRRFGSDAHGLMSFGAGGLAMALPGVAGWAMAAGAAVVGWALGRCRPDAVAPKVPASGLQDAALAAAVTVTCFGLVVSYSYKLIFLWPVVPWLLRSGRDVLGGWRANTWLVLLLIAAWLDGIVLVATNVGATQLGHDGRAVWIHVVRVAGVSSQIATWMLMAAGARLSWTWARAQLANGTRAASQPAGA